MKLKPIKNRLASKYWKSEATFLCRKGTRRFVSQCNLTKEPDDSMPANCKEGCVYVVGKDEYGDSMAFPVNELDEMQLIVGLK